MSSFILPFFLGTILVCGLWIHDVVYRHQERSTIKGTQRLYDRVEDLHA